MTTSIVSKYYIKNMKLKIMKMTCVNKSIAKEEAEKISCVRHKNLKFRFLLFVLLIPIATGSFFIACNSEDPFSGVEVNNVDTEMQQILGTHLTVENNRYVLKLSEADAITLGVSQSFYAKFLTEIAESNAFIESTENDPNISVSFNFGDDINYKPVRLKNGGNEIDGWNLLTTIYPLLTPNYSNTTFHIPVGTTQIRFSPRTATSNTINYRVYDPYNSLVFPAVNISIVLNPVTDHTYYLLSNKSVVES
jgi:hypothetical protein